MASLLSMGAGASEGLDKYLQRMMVEQQMQAAQQKTAADNDYRNRALEQSGEIARTNRDLLQQNREATQTAQLRDDERANIARMPRGTQFTPERYNNVIKLNAAAPEQFDNQANPDPAAMAGGVPSALAQNDPSGASTIRLRATPAELAADTRVEDAQRRADLAERSLQLRDEIGHGNLDTRRETEGRLAANPPISGVQMADGSVRWVTRGDAIGLTAPKPASERTEGDALSGLLQLAEGTLKQGDDSKWTGVGPIAGTLGKGIRDLTGWDVAGGDAGQNNRSNLSELESEMGFSRGGKALTEPEKASLRAFMSSVKQNPTVARQNLQRFVESVKRRREALNRGVVTPDGGAGGDDNDPAGLFK